MSPVEDTDSMDSMIQHLTDSANQIIRGNYDAAKRLFALTNHPSAPRNIQVLAETLGLMSVKIEAREMALEQKLEHIDRQNQELKEAAHLRAESGFMLCSTVLFFFAYSLTVKIGFAMNWIDDHSGLPVTIGLMLVMLAGMGLYLRKYHRPLSTWGLTLKGGWRSLSMTLPACLPLILLLIGVKAWLVRQAWSPWYGQLVFQRNWSLLPLIPYLLSVIVQEIIARGFIQNTAERVLDGKYSSLMAILLASALFSVAHLHYALPTVIGTFLAGLFLGWMYSVQRTLVGVITAHFLLSVAAWEWLGLIG